MSKTIDYYNNNAQAFYDRTISVDITDNYKRFLKYLEEKSKILDAGCGVGRDTAYFLSKGHAVTAFDASEEMVKFSSKETGVKVMHSTFQELNFENLFDGVWAQASLLHIPYNMTREIYGKIHRSLKSNGIFYASYKYGDNHMESSGRDFYNMNESKVMQYFDGLFNVIELWQEQDNRSKVVPSPNAMWLNFILRKV